MVFNRRPKVVFDAVFDGSLEFVELVNNYLGIYEDEREILSHSMHDQTALLSWYSDNGEWQRRKAKVMKRDRVSIVEHLGYRVLFIDSPNSFSQDNQSFTNIFKMAFKILEE